MTDINEERHYWILHEDTLWRYAISKGILNKKWKVEGFNISLAGLISGKISKESLPEVLRFKIFNEILSRLEKKEFILSFEKELKKIKSGMSLGEIWIYDDAVKKIDYDINKKLIKIFGKINFNGKFEDENGNFMVNFLPLSEKYEDISRRRHVSLGGTIPVIIDKNTRINDIIIPSYENWSNFYVVLIGSFSFDSVPLIRALAVYRDSQDFSEYIELYLNQYCPPDNLIKSDFLKGKDYDKIITDIRKSIGEYLVNILSEKGWKAEVDIDKEIFEIHFDLSNLAEILRSDKDGGIKIFQLDKDIEFRREIPNYTYKELSIDEGITSNNILKIKGKLETESFKKFIDDVLSTMDVDYSEFEEKLNNHLAYRYKMLKRIVEKEISSKQKK